MNEKGVVEEIDVSKFVKDIVVHYKNGFTKQIKEPYQLNQLQPFLSSMTLIDEREMNACLNKMDEEETKSTTGGDCNTAANETELKTQVLEVLRNIFSSGLSDTTQTNKKESLACDRIISQEIIKQSTEGGKWDEPF